MLIGPADKADKIFIFLSTTDDIFTLLFSSTPFGNFVFSENCCLRGEHSFVALARRLCLHLQSLSAVIATSPCQLQERTSLTLASISLFSPFSSPLGCVCNKVLWMKPSKPLYRIVTRTQWLTSPRCWSYSIENWRWADLVCAKVTSQSDESAPNETGVTLLGIESAHDRFVVSGTTVIVSMMQSVVT